MAVNTNNVHNKNANNATGENSNNLAAAVYATKPDDKLAVVDVYKKGGVSGTLNSIQDFGKKYKSNFENLFRGGKFASGILKEAKGIYNAVKSGDIASAIQRSVGMAGKYSGHVGKGTVDFLQNAQSYYNSHAPIIANGIEIYDKVKNNDWTNLSQSLALVSSVTNSDLIKAIDTGGYLASISSAVNEVARYGYSIYNEFNGIRSYIANELNGLGLDSFYSNSFDTGYSFSDLDLIEKVVDDVGGGHINSIRPNSIELIAKNYRIRYSATKGVNIPKRFKKIDEVFKKIDSQWYKNGSVFDFSKIREASLDFDTVFYAGILDNLNKEEREHKEYGKWALVAREFKLNPEQALENDLYVSLSR